jgi:flagellar hook-basal body complex protein FliE
MINNINAINSSLPSPTTAQKADKPGGGFAEQLKEAINSTNEAQLTADQAVEGLHSGQTGNLHEVMISLEKADISMRMFVALRNKAVSAYQEIMKMNV